MSGLFGKQPKVPQAPKVPTVDDARQAEEEVMKLRRKRGRASTFLSQTAARTGLSAADRLGATADSGSVAGATSSVRSERTGMGSGSRRAPL